MHTLSVKNFGPIKDIELCTSKSLFLIGEQASGKSTIVKLIYFFRTFSDEFVTLVFSKQDTWKDVRNQYISMLRNKFTNIFGNTSSLGGFYIKYMFSPDFYVEIMPSSKKGYLDIVLCNGLYRKLAEIWQEFYNLDKSIPGTEYIGYLSMLDRLKIRDNIIGNLRKVFLDEYSIIYAPAGRDLLSRQNIIRIINSEEARLSNSGIKYNIFEAVDSLTRSYIAETMRVREMIIGHSNEIYTSEESDSDYIDFIRSINELILKGSFLATNHGDFIQVSNDTRISMPFASSGQQEVVWILNIIYAYSLEKRKCVFIIEEPETHLHPSAQYMLIKSISAFCNYTGSNVIITTHSPYILSSLNNLIFAWKKGQSDARSEEISKIIPRQIWNSPDSYNSFIVDSGRLRDIKNYELGIVDISELDLIASVQDNEYEMMINVTKGDNKCIIN